MGYYQKHISIPIILSMLFFLKISVNSQTTSWFSNGPSGGYVNCVSVSKSNPNIVYIGTKQSIYKSEDKGKSWIKTGFRDYEIRSLKISPISSDIVFAGTYEKGFWKTSNGGVDWVFKGLSNNTINCITVDPNDPNKIYFGSGNQMKWGGCGIFRSTDGGVTFDPLIEWTAGDYVEQINSIFIDPDNSDHIYVARVASSDYGSFFYSTDGGTNWISKRMTTSSSEGIIYVAVARDSVGQKIVYVMAKSAYDPWANPSLYKTADLGDNWEEVACPYTSTYDPDVFMIDPNNPNTIYTGVRSSVNQILTYKTDQNQWAVIPRTGLPSINSTCIDISTETNPTIYLGTSYGGIYNFTTGVSSYWSQIVSGLNETYISDIAVLPSSPDLAYACVKDEYGLFKTLDGGVNWNWLTTSKPDLLAIDPQNPSTLFAAEGDQDGSDYYIYKSINGGLGWQQIKFFGCTGNDCSTKLTDILIHPTKSNNILIATQMRWNSSLGLHGFGTVARTIDGGNSWDQLLNVSSSALAIDPNNPDIIYSGKQKSGQIWKIENAWGVRNATEITPSEGMGNITDIELDNSSNVYVSTESGLWRYNAGNWTALTLPYIDIKSLAIDRDITPNTIYAGTGDNGVFISNDGGTTWNVWNYGLKNFAITKLKIGGLKVWIGTEYGGVWCRNTPNSVTTEYDLLFTSLADMNYAKYGAGYTFDGNYIYSICGGLGELPWISTSVERFNLGNNSWTEFVTDLIPRRYCSAEYVASQKKIYIFNGDTYTNTSYTDTVEIVDVQTGDLSYSATNPYPVENGGSAVWHDKVYLFGGSNSNGFSNRLYEFDPLTSNWTRLPDMPEAKQTNGEIINGVLYVFGGYSGSVSKRIDAYNIQNSTWSYLGDMPVGISAHATTKSGENIFIVGSYDDIKFLAVYKTETNNFTQLSSNMIGRRHAGASVVRDNLYIFGGNQPSTVLKSLEYSDIIVSVREQMNNESPKEYALSQNYPNPFNPSTTIHYSIPEQSNVTLEIFDILGRRVKILVDEHKNAGNYKIEFKSQNLSGGIYFYRIKAGEFSDMKKMLLLK